jgi:hypothetical protein
MSFEELQNLVSLYWSERNYYGEKRDFDVESLENIDPATSPKESHSDAHYDREQLRQLGYID